MLSDNKIKRVLIANRGEIAVRIIRSLKDLGLESVAIYSKFDSQSLHCGLADFAIPLDGESNLETYLNIEQIIRVAKLSHADAIHPGYGFLSENAEFCKACEENEITFIGPSSKAMLLMGDKIKAKALMKEYQVPVIPDSEGALKSFDHLSSVVDKIGLPIILKAAAGGGGRGMRIVKKREELQASYEACKREAKSYFGNDSVFCERYLENPKHIEFQVLFDNYGHGVHLFERDCSVQRRHQKLFEEAPSTYLDDKQRNHLGALAINAAKAAGYSGAGTIEFICEAPDKVYFMEMNTRIQVEHPVTEYITGIDLIASQIRVAAGEPLGFEQQDIQLNGWCLEARINAEDPKQNFIPTPGQITKCELPKGPFVRVDSHIYSSYTIPSMYDSMIAKIIVWGKNRQEALNRMSRCLGEITLQGVNTTLAFHEVLVKHPKFVSGDYNTGFCEQEHAYFAEAMDKVSEAQKVDSIIAAAACFLQVSQKEIPTFRDNRELWQQTALKESRRKLEDFS